jgi:hypothetical protein
VALNEIEQTGIHRARVYQERVSALLWSQEIGVGETDYGKVKEELHMAVSS